MVSSQKRMQATLLGLIAIFCWATLPVVSIFTKEVPPFLCLSIAYLVAFIVYLIYWKYQYGQIKQKFRQPLDYMLIYMIGIFSANATFLIALQHGNPVVSYLASNVWPIFVLFLAAIFFREKIGMLSYIGAFIGFLGVAFIAIQDGGVDMGKEEIIGLVVGLINAALWATVSVLNKRFTHIPADSIGFPLGIASIFAFIAHLLFEESVTLSISHLLAIIYLGIAPWGMAHTIWGYSLRFGDVKMIMLLSYFTPLLGVILMIIFADTAFSMNVVISLLLILGGAGVGSMKPLLSKMRSLFTAHTSQKH